jgi:hypothetical protein
MTPSQVALVREGYARIAPRSDSVCLAFCHRLFELDLSLRTLFPSDLPADDDPGRRAGDTDALARRPSTGVGPRGALGLRLASYEVQPADVSVAAAAFLATLDDELGEAFTDAARAVWRHVFWTVALVAMDAMAEAFPAVA